MNSKKNFLVFAVILNFVFFIGVSAWVQLQVRHGDEHRSMAAWLGDHSFHFNSQFLNDTSDARTLVYQLSQAPSVAQKKSLLSADEDLTMAFEFDGQKLLELKGDRKSFPFATPLFTTGQVGFFLREKNLFLTYFAHSTAPKNVHTMLVIKKPRNFLDKLIKYSGTLLAIVEQDANKPTILFTNLTDEQGQDLLSQLDFEKEGLPLGADKSLLAQNTFYVTLQRQKFLAVTINLTHTDNFKQKLVYFFQAPDYETLSLGQLHLILWTLFCISLGVVFLIARRKID